MWKRIAEFFRRDLRETLGSSPVAALVGVGVILVTIAIMVAVTLLADRAAESRRDRLSEELEPLVRSLAEVETDILTTSTTLNGSILTQEPLFQERYSAIKIELGNDTRALIEAGKGTAYEEALQTIVRQSLDYIIATDRVVNLGVQGNFAEAEELIAGDTQSALDTVVSSIESTDAQARVEIARLRDRIQQIDSIETAVLILTAPMVVIAAGVLVWLALSNQRLVSRTRGERARFASIISSITEYGVCEADPQGRLIFANKAAERLLGCEDGALIGNDLHQALHGREDVAANCALALTLRGAAPGHHVQDSFQRSDGSSMPVEISSAPIAVSGQTTGTVLVFQDISERLRSDQFRQQFLSFASHELRSPLTIISGFAQQLVRRVRREPQAFDEQTQDAINEMASGTARMRRITEVVLDLARIESGRGLPVDLRELDLKQLLDRESRIVKTNHPGVRLEATYPSHEVIVLSDKELLSQVLFNLLDNAAKYGSSEPVVQIQVAQEDSRAIVSVRDNGPGIPQDERPRIFEPFYRASGMRGKSGLGVGLFITKKIADQVGATLSFETEEGRGTEFTLALPLPEDQRRA